MPSCCYLSLHGQVCGSLTIRAAEGQVKCGLLCAAAPTAVYHVRYRQINLLVLIQVSGQATALVLQQHGWRLDCFNLPAADRAPTMPAAARQHVYVLQKGIWIHSSAFCRSQSSTDSGPVLWRRACK